MEFKTSWKTGYNMPSRRKWVQGRGGYVQIWGGGGGGGSNSLNSNKIVENLKFKFRSNTSLLLGSKENISEFHKV